MPAFSPIAWSFSVNGLKLGASPPVRADGNLSSRMIMRPSGIRRFSAQPSSMLM
jgi:hypothetical protein